MVTIIILNIIIIIVTALPSAPLNPACTNPTVSSVTIEWNPPTDNGGENIIYAVTVTPGDISNTTAMTSFLVSDLTPLTEYTFTVRACNTVGYSVENVTVMCSTPGEGIFILSFHINPNLCVILPLLCIFCITIILFLRCKLSNSVST